MEVVGFLFCLDGKERDSVVILNDEKSFCSELVLTDDKVFVFTILETLSLLFSSKGGNKEVAFPSSIGESDIVCSSVVFIVIEELVNFVDGSLGTKWCNKGGISEVIESFAGIEEEEEERLVIFGLALAEVVER